MARPRSTGGVYKRPDSPVFWCWFWIADQRIQQSTGATDERSAKKHLNEQREAVKAGTWRGKDGKPATLTFADEWTAWLAKRSDVKTLDDDFAAGENHILPVFGEKALADITPGDLTDFFALLRSKVGPRGKPLAKNTIRNIVGRLSTFLRHAEMHRKIERSPFRSLERADRPKKATRHELKESKRVFRQNEIEALLFDERVPDDRRVLYALQFFTGTRFGEAAGFLWSDWNEDDQTLSIIRQYGGEPLKGPRNEPGAPRTAPVHETLRTILEAWRADVTLHAMLGHAPRPDDPIVPSRTGRTRSLRHSSNRLKEDLERLGFVPTEQTHGFRRAFTTIAKANGGAPFWVERITHNAAGGVDAGYTDDDLGAMRRAVECIPIHCYADCYVGTETAGIFRKKERGGRDLNPRPPA